MSYQGGGLGWIRDIAIPFDENRVYRLRPAQDISKPQFSLRIRPVGFKASCDDPEPSGGSAKDQLDEAVKIWRHCGIELDVQEIQYLVNKDLKEGNSVEEMRRCWGDPIRRTVEVFFSASDSFPDGGGQSVNRGMAQAAIAVTDNNKHLPYLVAHEIGHILYGIHPTDNVDEYGEWNGDDKSVLEPKGGGVKQPTVLGQGKCEKPETPRWRFSNHERVPHPGMRRNAFSGSSLESRYSSPRVHPHRRTGEARVKANCTIYLLK